MRKRALRKVQWRKGSGEILGFVMMIPIIILFCFGMLLIAQLGLVKMVMEEAVYIGARSAVVCESLADAKEAGTSAAKSVLQNSAFGIDYENIVVEVNVAGGSSDPMLGSAGPTSIKWEKGALLEFTIKAPIQKMVLEIGPEQMTSTIYMMVERPAPTY